MKFLTKIALFSSVLWLPACATATRGPHVDFHVITDPPSATVTTNLQTPETRREILRRQELVRLGFRDEIGDVEIEHYSCESTPCEFKLPRRSEFTLTVEREGYHTATVEVTSGFGNDAASSSVAGAAATATGAYVVSYSVVSALSSTLVSILTLGTTTASSAGAASAATTSAAGIGILFLGVDVVSGAMLDLRPNPVALILIPIDQPLPDASTVYIDTEEKLEDVLRTRASGEDNTDPSS